MKTFELHAELREQLGTRASRRLRRTGKIPALVYGCNKETTAITLDHNDVMHHLEHEAFFSHILSLKIKKKRQEKVILKDLQRHPCKPFLLHLDLQRIDEESKLTVRVPLHYLNEEKCVGVKMGGGMISHIITELEVSCLPKHLPEYIEVDMESIELGETIHLGDLVLPDNVENHSLSQAGLMQPVATVQLPKRIVADEQTSSEEEEETETTPSTGQSDEG